MALLLRFKSGEIAFLEATETVGVTLISWHRFKRNNWQSLYSKLVFRHVFYKRTPSFLRTLENFIEQVKGKKYDINPSKILSKFRSKKKTNCNQNEGYFCSELVAAAY